MCRLKGNTVAGLPIKVPVRRALALLMLVLTFGSGVESVVGLLRDGEVHHESGASAVAHAAQSSGGDHGHEDAAPSGAHRHGRGHEHGTTNDHCTHTHSVALAPVFAFSLPAREFVLTYAEPVVHTGTGPRPLFHPPRA